MARTHRSENPPPEWRATFALSDKRPIADLVSFLESNPPNLKRGQVLTPEDVKMLADLRLVLIHLAAAVDPEGVSEYQLKLVRRRPGKPVDKRARADRAYAAVAHVERQLAAGIKQEAAIAEAADEFELSRAEIFKWLRTVRNRTALIAARQAREQSS